METPIRNDWHEELDYRVLGANRSSSMTPQRAPPRPPQDPRIPQDHPQNPLQEQDGWVFYLFGKRTAFLGPPNPLNTLQRPPRPPPQDPPKPQDPLLIIRRFFRMNSNLYIYNYLYIYICIIYIYIHTLVSFIYFIPQSTLGLQVYK